MSVRLTVKQRSEAGGATNATELLLNEARITLGRDKGCDVVLAQRAVSRTHARISRDGALFFLEDLGSAFGTLINGKSLPKGEKRLLRNGDVIAIAEFDLTFDRVAELPKDATADKTAFVARQVVKDAMRGLGGGGEEPYFRIMNGPREGERLELAETQELVIGRDDSADIIFQDDLVSRRHCKLRRDWSGIHVEDLDSRNGIKINRKRVSRRTLKDQDELEVGSIRLLFLDPSEIREAPVVLPDEEGESTRHEEAEEAVEPPLSTEPSESEASHQEASHPSQAEASEAEEAAEASASAASQSVQESSQAEEGSQADEGSEAEEGSQADEEDDEEFYEEDGPPQEPGIAGLLKGDKRRLIAIVAMLAFALVALIFVVLLFAGV